ncbi:MAG: TonB-dependent receptor [Cyclobacteriaceae bacterium]
MRKKIVSTLSGILVLSQLFGQDSLKNTVLNEVVVSATRTEKPIIEIPRSVSVISRDQLNKSIYNSVGELLSSEHGIYVVGAGQTPGSAQSLFLRGANSNQVVILIDGVRITDPSTPNSVIDLSELSLTNVEQIEIIRGSHSTAYGGSAVGGTINIVTRKSQQPGLNGIASLQLGTFGDKAYVVSPAVDFNYALKNGVYFNGSVVNQTSNGFNATLDTIRTPGVYKTTDRDGFLKTDVYLKTGYDRGNWSGAISFKQGNQHADIDKGIYADDENNYIDFERRLLNYNLGYQLNNSWRVDFNGSWSESERINENDSSHIDDLNYDGNYFYGKYFGKLNTNEIQLKYQFKNVDGVFGGGVYAEGMNFNTYFFSNAFGPFELVTDYDSIKTTANTKYAFGQVNWAINKFRLFGGLRFSNHSLFGNAVTFEINPSYLVSTFNLFASVSSGYNAPSLYQLYDPTQDFGSYTDKGNPDLKPEASLSFEVGVKKEFNNGNYFTLSAFQTSVKNSIEYVYIWNKDVDIPDLSYLDYKGDTYLNITRQETKGLELDMYVTFLEKFFIQSNLTWITGELTFSPSSIDTTQTGQHHVQLYSYGTFVTDEVRKDELVRRPKLTSCVTVGFSPMKSLSTSITYRYAGARQDSQYDYSLGPYGALSQSSVANYSLFDVNATWQVSRGLSLGLRIENLFDVSYQEIIGYQTRGRSAYLKVGIEW